MQSVQGTSALKMVTGRGPGKDKAGRPVKQRPAFRRTLPDKPDDLGPDGSHLWDLVVAELPLIDRLKELDGLSLEMACRTVDRWRVAVDMRREHGITKLGPQGETVAPWVKVEVDCSRDYRTWCQEFGLTPAAELKLSTQNVDPNATDQDNPFG